MNRHMYILADGGRIAASGPSEFVRHAGAFHGRPEKVRLHQGLREPVPLLLRSLPVHSSPVGIFFFFHSI